MMWRKKRERDLDRELRDHLDLEAEEQHDSAAARRALGNLTLIREAVREAWGWTSLDETLRNARQALRALRKSPVFTLVAILSLAVAIGANTAVFSMARGIVLKTLPAPGANRLVLIRQQNQAFHIEQCCFPYTFFRELRKADPDFDDALAVGTSGVTLTESGQTEKLEAEIVSPNYFRMLDVHPALGRLLDESDENSGHACVISYDLWQELFGGRSDVVGLPVILEGEPFRIAGVTQRGFRGAALHARRDLQVPAWIAGKLIGQDAFWAQTLARLRPGVRPKPAQARLNVTGKQVLERVFGKPNPRDDFYLRDGSQGIDSQKEKYGEPVRILFLLVTVVLLVACANLAALLLVRSVERTREAGMRLAIGASRGAVMRQFLGESLLVAIAGGAAGWFVAQAVTRVLLALLDPRSAGLALQARPDAVVFAFCAAVTVCAGLLFGILPAWRAARVDPLAAIHGASAAGKRSYLSGALIAGQIALSLALLFAAGLFTRTLRNLHAIDLGFQPENLVMLGIDHSAAPAGAKSYFEELLRSAQELPETRAAGLSQVSLLSGNMMAFSVKIPGYAAPNGVMSTAMFSLVSPDYFRTLGIPLLAGEFTGEDGVIVNQQFARTFFGGDALGKTFTFGGTQKARVTGIAGTAKFRFLREDPSPVMYVPLSRRFPSVLVLQVRTSGKPSETMDRLRALARAIDPGAPITSATTMEAQIDEALARERMLSFLSVFLGGISLVLASVGLYGVLSYAVSRRTREIGIRMAVGADRRGILALVFKDTLWILLAGLAAGVPLALACGSLAASLLYGLKPQDAGTAAAATVVLALAAVAASLLPAWKAARVDPMAALRCD